MNIRRATEADFDSVLSIYDKIHTAEEKGLITIGWNRAIYPTAATVEAALKRNDLFVLLDNDCIIGAGVINKMQVEAYRLANWEYEADDDSVMVLHTLAISPEAKGKGYGKAFVKFYEDYAAQHGCDMLRIDTNARNTVAREMYKKLGYKEIDIIPTVFNGLKGVDLVLLEKKL